MKYPINLFFIGFFMNLIRNFYLLIPAIALLIVGIWINWCLILGVALLIANIVVSFIQQLQIRKATLKSDNPNFTPWQEAILSPDWKENIKNTIDSVIEETESGD